MRKARNCESCFWDLIEHLPAVVFRIARSGDDWTVLYVTESVSRYGYAKEAFLKGEVRWVDVVHPDDRPVVFRQLRDYAARGVRDFRMNCRVVCKNGDILPVTCHNTVCLDADGTVDYCDVVMYANESLVLPERQASSERFRQQFVLNDILMGLHDSDLEHAIRIILERTGSYLDSSRVQLFRDDSDHETCRIVYEWCNHDIRPMLECGYVLRYDEDLPEVRDALRDNDSMAIDYGDMPEGSRAFFKREGVIAGAIFPVYLMGERYGFVAFGDCVIQRRWDSDIVRFLQNVASILSTALMRRHSAEQLDLTQKTCETVLHNIDTYIFALDPVTGKIIFANRAFQDAFGCDCLGRSFWEFIEISLEDLVAKTNTDPGNHRFLEVFCERTGEWLSVTHELVPWIDGNEARLVTCYDVTAQRQHEEATERLAFLDPLTGLANRHRLDVDLRNVARETRGSGKKGYLFFIDMDDFKVVNDSFGHDYGDEVLKSLAAYLRTFAEKGNLVFRFGGDEFIVLVMPDNAAFVDAYLEGLLERAASPWKAKDREFYCSLSIGVVEFTGWEDATSIVKNADIAMYEAKQRGKNNYAFYRADFDEGAIVRTRTESMLRTAMKNDFQGFELFYQPVLRAATGELLEAEALLRMRDEAGNLVMPDEFIPLAEYLGFMSELGQFVFRRAFEQCRRINDAGCNDFAVAVNLSRKQMGQKDLIEVIDAIVEETGVRAENVRIGLDESAVLDQPDRVRRTVARLVQRGFGVTLDHFGGGNASLMSLKDLPITMIKTAPSFMRDATDDSYAKEFLELLVRWSHAREKGICVNGVESEEQFAFCKEIGADFVQGFYFSKPLDSGQLERIYCESIAEAGQ